MKRSVVWWIILVLVLVWYFFVRNRTINKDHGLCISEVENKITEILTYKESLGDLNVWDLKVKGVNLWNFNLWNIKLSEVDVQYHSTDFLKNHYSLFNRSYELSVNFSVKTFEFKVPVNCGVKGGIAELQLGDLSKN